MQKKYWTLAEANAALPMVQNELVALQLIKAKYEHQFAELKELRYEDRSADRVFALECELEFLQLEARLHIGNITKQGIELKDIDAGLIDFPAMVGGEEVLLCWRIGEDHITHYHGLHDGFAGRKPILGLEGGEDA